MKSTGKTYIYIAITPKRWRITRAFQTLVAMDRLSEFEGKGYALGGIHPGVGVRTNFVYSLQFASRQEKEEYENTNTFPYLLKKLNKYSKRGKLKILR